MHLKVYWCKCYSLCCRCSNYYICCRTMRVITVCMVCGKTVNKIFCKLLINDNKQTAQYDNQTQQLFSLNNSTIIFSTHTESIRFIVYYTKQGGSLFLSLASLFQRLLIFLYFCHVFCWVAMNVGKFVKYFCLKDYNDNKWRSSANTNTFLSKWKNERMYE